MIRIVSVIFLSIFIFTFFPISTANADQTQNNSFFSFLEKSILAYTSGISNQHVLAAQTQITIAPTTLFPTILPTSQPTPPIQTPQLSIISTYILNGVNEYRTSLGLSPVQASDETCAFAAIRAQEISHGFNHNGFYERVKNHTLPYSWWAHATENIAEAPDYHEIVKLWKNSPEHAANMRDNTPYVCIEKYGPYYAYEGMRP